MPLPQPSTNTCEILQATRPLFACLAVTGTPVCPAGLAPSALPRPRGQRRFSPVHRTPTLVSVMEKPTGHTRATSWHPPWLQVRSQPYSPQGPWVSKQAWHKRARGRQSQPHPDCPQVLWGAVLGQTQFCPPSSCDLGRDSASASPLHSGSERCLLPGWHPHQPCFPVTWAGGPLLPALAGADIGCHADAAPTAEGAES